MVDTLAWLPYLIPFAVATVIGGIDCTESAASAGDRYDTRQIVGVEALATFVAGLCGGVIQTTPYIGHPAYKAMGGRAAYTLATALLVGGAGVIGWFSVIFRIIPEAAILPILIFIAVEITAQSFLATPRRHYAALALACMPLLARLVMIYVDQVLPVVSMAELAPEDAERLNSLLLHLRVLAGGFIITSVIWAAALAKIIDRRFYSASLWLAIAGILVLFGIIHSPVPGDRMFWPWQAGLVPGPSGGLVADAAIRKVILEFSAAYLLMALILFVLGWWLRPAPIDSDTQYEQMGR
jgi:AGZA family xanthine/uracil permease-like MFS transporter